MKGGKEERKGYGVNEERKVWREEKWKNKGRKEKIKRILSRKMN